MGGVVFHAVVVAVEHELGFVMRFEKFGKQEPHCVHTQIA